MLRLKWFWLVILVVLLMGSAVFASGSNDYRSGAGTLTLNEVSRGTVSYPSDTMDWYKVYVPESGVFIAFMDGRQERDIDLYLYSSSGDLLAQSTNSSEDGVVYGHVAGGWYYIKIVVAFDSYGSVDYDVGALFTDHSTGYLRATKDVDLHSLYMSSNRVYWIFLVDQDGFFDPDLFLVYGDKILDSSRHEGDLDEVTVYPDFSGTYVVAVGSAQGNGYYYVLIGTRAR